jgi:hypothetical protein
MLTMLYVFIPSRPVPTHNVNIPRLQNTCGMKRGRQELLIMTWGEGWTLVRRWGGGWLGWMMLVPWNIGYRRHPSSLHCLETMPRISMWNVSVWKERWGDGGMGETLVNRTHTAALLYRSHYRIKTLQSKVWIRFVLCTWRRSRP